MGSTSRFTFAFSTYGSPVKTFDHIRSARPETRYFNIMSPIYSTNNGKSRRIRAKFFMTELSVVLLSGGAIEVAPQCKACLLNIEDFFGDVFHMIAEWEMPLSRKLNDPAGWWKPFAENYEKDGALQVAIKFG